MLVSILASRTVRNAVTQGAQRLANTAAGQFVAGIGDSIAQTATSAWRGIQEAYNLSPRPPTITLQRRKYNEYNGDLMEMDEDLGNVRGPACTPTIVGTWMRTHDDTRIVDNGDKDPSDKLKDNDDLTKGYPSVTTESFLVCYCGGFISPVSCGQNFDLRPQQEQSNETET